MTNPKNRISLKRKSEQHPMSMLGDVVPCREKDGVAILTMIGTLVVNLLDGHEIPGVVVA